MTTSEQNDPEASYRRGYQQGAFDALASAEKVGFRCPEALRKWVDIVLYDWRYGKKKSDRSVMPPDAP